MAGQRRAEKWLTQVDRNTWAIWYDGQPMATERTPARTQAEWIERLMEAYEDATIELDRLRSELAEERAACAKLAAWAETVKGRSDDAPVA